MSSDKDRENSEEYTNSTNKFSKKSASVQEKINYDEVDFSTLDNSNKKAYTDLFTGLLDIYMVVGAKPDESQESINKKCAYKKAQLHVDKRKKILEKVPPEQRANENKKLDKQYKLVCDASKILRDPERRKYYDLQKKTIDSKDFFKQKTSFKTQLDLQESGITEQTKKNSLNNFKMGMLDFDKKHAFDRQALNDKPMDSSESSKRLEDLEWTRQEQEDEYTPKDFFKGKLPTSTEFNKLWDKMNSGKNKSKNKNKDDSLVAWDGITASNDLGLTGSSNFISIESNYEDLYDVNNFNSSEFASKLDSDSDSDESEINFSPSDLNNIDASYVTNHNKNKEDVMSKFNDLENRRKQENDAYETREFGDNKVWGSVSENPMNISSQMGCIIGGKDVKQLSGPRKKKHISKDEIEAYKQLIYEENVDSK
jgi:hypothetical protein